jgi:phospholipid/cholesterol/gamma-HCH transport system substrate-binding protein
LDPKPNEIRVGLAVLISLVALVGGIIWGKGYRLKSNRYTIEVVFSNVGGLESGANVLANGVVKGKVTRILLAEGKVIVYAAVDKNVTLYSDYRATVESPTVMAGKALSLTPGSKLPPADITQPLIGENPVGVSEAVAVFQNISADLRVALRDLDTLLVNLNRVAADTMTRVHLTGMLSDASEVAHNANEWIRDNRSHLTHSLVSLDSTLNAAQSMIKSTEGKLSGTLVSADTAAQRLSALSASLRDAMDQVNRKEGTLGKIVYSDDLYQRLAHTLAEIDSLAVSIRTKGMKQRIVLF